MEQIILLADLAKNKNPRDLTPDERLALSITNQEAPTEPLVWELMISNFQLGRKYWAHD